VSKHHELQASQDQQEGRLFLSGAIFTAVCGYQIDNHSVTLTNLGNGVLQVYFEVIVPAGRERLPMLGGETELPVRFGFDHFGWVKTLQVVFDYTSVELPVKQLSYPDPTD
jgi:hypothetical protein|tara:strand:+ start:68143 stop:68475 length:333 start_codon:yes stop_codon:yes gene_type:complete